MRYMMPLQFVIHIQNENELFEMNAHIIEEMKKSVRWTMDWTRSKAASPDNENIQSKPDSEIMFETEIALAVLLYAGVVFTNDYWWMKEKNWPEDTCKKISLNVNTNDVLVWGCADSCDMNYEDIQEVYEYWEKDPSWGTAVWYCKKLKMMPQKPVADSIRKMGIWDIDNMGLEKNPTDGDFDE